MIKCVIIEDQAPAQRVLETFIQQVDDLELLKTFNNAVSALEYLKTTKADLVFLDIHLPKLSGIDFMKILPDKPQIILTTAFPDYALKSYDFDVADYLLKPFSFDRFCKALDKVRTRMQWNLPAQQDEQLILIKNGFDYINIPAKDIVFIKADGDYTKVYCSSEMLLVSYSLKYWLEQLDGRAFCQVHKSYIVNTTHIQRVSGNTILLNEHSIPIGRVFKQGFLDFFTDNQNTADSKE